MEILTITDLHVSYDNNKVIEYLSLSLTKGKIHGLVGLNGSGKTTLLNVIYGFVQAEQGDIRFSAESVHGTIAYLETNNYFYSRITGKEYLDLFKLGNPSFDVGGWNVLFELPLKKLIETYSTGMKKKLALLGILCLDRPFLMLDEPFNGLDLESGRNMQHILKELRENGKTILITSHITETLTRNCDTISFLNNKRIEATLSREDFDQVENEFFRPKDDKNSQLINKLLRKNLSGEQ